MKNKIIRQYKHTLLLGICLLAFAYAAGAQTKMESFAGVWNLNETASDFGRLTAASASKIRELHIDQTADNIRLSTGNETDKTVLAINLVGKPSEQTGSTVVYGIPNTLTSDIAVKLLSGRSFATTVNNDPLGMAATSEKTYSISEDGKTLTIEYKNSYGEQILAGKLIYNKQL